MCHSSLEIFITDLGECNIKTLMYIIRFMCKCQMFHKCDYITQRSVLQHIYRRSFQLFGIAAFAENLCPVGEESSSNQRQWTLRTLKTRLMPLTLLKRDVLPFSKTCDGFVAGGTFLGVQVTEALHTVRIFTLRCERLSGQLDFTTRTQETLFMPGLVSVRNATLNQDLFAVGAAWWESSLVTGHAVVLALIWDERLAADGLLTAAANKTFLVPRAASVLQPLGAWHHSLCAGHTFRGKLIAVTLVTHQGVFLTGERLVGQRTAAARAAETVFVIMPVLIIQLPWVVFDELFAFLAGVCIQPVVTRDAVGNIVHLDVFPAVQRLLTTATVKRLWHDAPLLCSLTHTTQSVDWDAL